MKIINSKKAQENNTINTIIILAVILFASIGLFGVINANITEQQGSIESATESVTPTFNQTQSLSNTDIVTGTDNVTSNQTITLIEKDDFNNRSGNTVGNDWVEGGSDVSLIRIIVTNNDTNQVRHRRTFDNAGETLTKLSLIPDTSIYDRIEWSTDLRINTSNMGVGGYTMNFPSISGSFAHIRYLGNATGNNDIQLQCRDATTTNQGLIFNDTVTGIFKANLKFIAYSNNTGDCIVTLENGTTNTLTFSNSNFANADDVSFDWDVGNTGDGITRETFIDNVIVKGYSNNQTILIADTDYILIESTGDFTLQNEAYDNEELTATYNFGQIDDGIEFTILRVALILLGFVLIFIISLPFLKELNRVQ